MNIDNDLNLKSIPNPFEDEKLSLDDLLYNLQRLTGYFMGRDALAASRSVWWAEQLVRDKMEKAERREIT